MKQFYNLGARLSDGVLQLVLEALKDSGLVMRNLWV